MRAFKWAKTTGCKKVKCPMFFSDINECAGSPCDANAQCQNSGGTFQCTCNTGYSGSGTSCTGEDSMIMSIISWYWTDFFQWVLKHDLPYLGLHCIQSSTSSIFLFWLFWHESFTMFARLIHACNYPLHFQTSVGKGEWLSKFSAFNFSFQISMSVKLLLVILKLHVPTVLAHLLVHVTVDIVAMELTAQVRTP